MFQKILLYVDDRPESAVAAERALRMARVGDARVFATWVLPESGNPAAARTGRRAPRTKAAPDEEHAWSRLYEIEDDAFEQDVKISLLLETGNRDEKLLGLIDSYQLDALVIGTRTAKGWEDLIQRSPVTVILAR
jgi:nucleotide-binding universal stress UspA family protein